MLDRLDGAGARVLRTDREGTLVVKARRDGSYRLEGRAEGEAKGQCRRCLKDIRLPFDVEFDALFVDWRMPFVEGIEVVRAARGAGVPAQPPDGVRETDLRIGGV